MNVGGIIFLKWAVCICKRSPFIFLVSACSLAHFYRWKKKQQLQLIRSAKTSNTKLSTLQRELDGGYYV